MTCSFFYSSKILSLRQKVILFVSMSLCFCLLIYTYLLCEYFFDSMIASVADSSPHIRIFLNNNSSIDDLKILHELQKESKVLRADTGYFINKNVKLKIIQKSISVSVDNDIISNFEDFTQNNDGITRTEYVLSDQNINFIAYSFENKNYLPPILIENVSIYGKNPYMLDEEYRNCRKNPCIVTAYPAPEELFGITSGHDNNFTIYSSSTNTSFELCTAGFLYSNPFIFDYTPHISSIILSKDSFLQLMKLFPNDSYDNVIDISLKNRQDAQNFAQKLNTKYNFKKIETWIESNKTVIPFLKSIKFIIYISIFSIILLTIIGIYILINMHIIEKSKQLAILYALGQSTFQLRLIFLLIGIKISVASIIFGSIICFLLTKCSISSWIEITNLFCNAQNVNFQHSIMPISCFSLGLIILCSLACWLPTQNIVKSNPINTIREN